MDDTIHILQSPHQVVPVGYIALNEMRIRRHP